jgi:hypothetical protein
MSHPLGRRDCPEREAESPIRERQSILCHSARRFKRGGQQIGSGDSAFGAAEALLGRASRSSLTKVDALNIEFRVEPDCEPPSGSGTGNKTVEAPDDSGRQVAPPEAQTPDPFRVLELRHRRDEA